MQRHPRGLILNIGAYQSNSLGQAIRRKLRNFISGVGEDRRTVISANGEALVSIVNPDQYRTEVRDLSDAEIKDVTLSLRPDLRAVITGLHSEVNRVRSGDLNLALYISYKYQFIQPRPALS